DQQSQQDKQDQQSQQDKQDQQSQQDKQDQQSQQDKQEPLNAQEMTKDNTAPEEALPADMQRALRSLADDPQILLRNKMQLEYQKRHQNGAQPKDNQQW
ncbi:hypothetical protein L2764_23560, partial [Shewanella surugensis]|nr:hypothetical protein [Shewanella surugensis]